MKSMFLLSLTLAACTCAIVPHSYAQTLKTRGSAVAMTPRYYGAVDLGSKGTKAALYSFVTEEEGRNPIVVYSKTVNTSLVSSMVGDRFSPAGIADATSAVKQVVDAMKAEAVKQKIKVDVYYVVASSGVAHARNTADLVASVKAATGIDVDTVTAKQESFYGLTSAVPLSRRGSSMYVDVGSGNAKLGCIIGDPEIINVRSAEIPYGSVSGRNEALKRDPDDLNAGIASVMKEVTKSYENLSRDIPCLRNRTRIYWTGGAAWATSTFMHPEKEMSGWVTITKHDLDVFTTRLKDGSWNQKRAVFNFPEDMPASRQRAIRAKSARSREDVQNVFVREDILAGVSVMQAVLKSSNPSASIHFARSGNFIYGYALDKFKEDAPSPEN